MKECESIHVKLEILHPYIPHSIMGSHPLPTMGTMKKVDPHRVQRLAINVM